MLVGPLSGRTLAMLMLTVFPVPADTWITTHQAKAAVIMDTGLK